MPVVAGFVPTPEGRAALESGIEEATRRETTLVVVVHATRGSDAETIEAAVEEARQTLETSDVAHEVRHVERGNDVADDLVQIAEDLSADLIVIGLRRRSPVGKLILGSNAQRILLDATCPVLAVKPVRPA
ncbi:universal stress protein [Pseudactinotalea sp.]|uniref:universal stress protein n=1 Tax=Pseudactinotalea sp. TaxID=1926260 RepID=UPI003B3AEEEC